MHTSYSNSVSVGSDSNNIDFEVKQREDNEEAKYRDYKEQLVKEKQKIKRLQEIELLKAEIHAESRLLTDFQKKQ